MNWFGGESGYSDVEIRAMVRGIEARRIKGEALKPIRKPAANADGRERRRWQQHSLPMIDHYGTVGGGQG